MTNKDTERLVQMHMQQTIPDKAALWKRIESNLPEQPAFPENRKPVSGIRMVYRVMGAAACFLLLIGGLRIVTALHNSKNETMNFSTASPAVDAPVAPAEEAGDCDAAEDAPAELAGEAGDCDADEDNADFVQNSQKFDFSADNVNSAERSYEKQADAGRAEDAVVESGETICLTGTFYGEELILHVDAVLLDEAAQILQSAPDTQTKNPPMTEEAEKNGILLTFEMGGQTICLTAVDHTCQMVADGIAYTAPAEFVRFVEESAE